MTTTTNGAQTKVSDLMLQLRHEWEQLQTNERDTGIKEDESRAELLARYSGKGMHQKEIGEAVGTTQNYVSKLLRYHRFCNTTVLQIPEGRFRAYWEQIADRQALKGKRTPEFIAAYEAKVFASISEMIESGKAPQRTKRKPKQVQAKDIKSIKQVKKAARQVYDRLKPTLTKLQGLLHCDRSTFAPAIIGSYAQELDREIKELFKLLGDVRDE